METAMEAARGDRARLAAESADVLYHLMALWAAAGVAPGAALDILRARMGVSGVAEKAARKRPSKP